MEREFTETERKRWNEVLIGCLHKFISICNEHNLTYYCLGGTVIGAVRHGGLIPWDDDIDMGMPRPDYERFLEIAQTTDLGGYEVASPRKKGYPCYFSKLCDANTSLIEIENVPCLYGIYIDIFPIDGAPENREDAEREMRLFKRISNKIDASLARLSFKEYLSLALKPKEWGRMLFQTLGYIIGRENIRLWLIRRLDDIAKKHNFADSVNIANYGGAWAEKEIHPKKWILPLTIKKFEDIEVFIPGNYDSYLKQMYGDYMQLPPIEKRVSHHSHAFVDMYKRVSLKHYL